MTSTRTPKHPPFSTGVRHHATYVPSTPAQRSGATSAAQAPERIAREVAETKERLLAWIRDPEYPGRALHFAERGARQALGGSLYKITAACEELEREGRLVRLVELEGEPAHQGRHRGWGLRGAVPPRRTLAELVTHVRQAPEPTDAPRSGPKSALAEATPLTALSQTQKKDILSAANLIAEFAPGAGGDPARITADYLARVVETPDGRRPWKLELESQEWVNARAKSRLRNGERWVPADSASARSKAKSGVKTLLHYAQSIGWLQPGETGFSNAIHTYAPEWHHVVLRWRARLARREGGTGESSIRVGIQTLALYATRQGSTDPRTTDWDAVLDEIEADHKAKGLQTYQRQAARWVWRRIHLLSRVRELSTSQEQRVALVPQQAAKRVVASIATASSAADIDFGGWVDEDGVPLSGLVEGPYGLRQWVWFTAGSVVGVAGDKKLPARTYESTYRRRPKRERIEEVTLQSRLEWVSYIAGWAARHDGLVFTASVAATGCTMQNLKGTMPSSSALSDGIITSDAATLISLMDGDRLTRYLTWRKISEEQRDAGGAHVRNLLGMLRRAAQDIALLAAHNKDDATHAAVPSLLEGINRQARVTVVRSDDDHFRDCVAINEAWRAGVDRRHGLQKLVDLRDLLIGDACAAANLDVEQQLSQLRAHRNNLAALRAHRRKQHEESEAEKQARASYRAATAWRTATWAIALRRAILIQFGRKVPLREDALRHLSPAMLESTKDGKQVDPWVDGATVIVHAPSDFTKNGKSYDAAYVAHDMAGLPGHEEGAARFLLELWLSPGGALEWFQEQAPEGLDTDVFFPINANKGVKGHGERAARTSIRMAAGGLTSDWRAVVMRHGPALGVDVRRLRQINGGLGIHSLRYLFGRYWAAIQGQLVYASEMLHHNDLDITINRYVGRSTTTISRDVMAVDGVRGTGQELVPNDPEGMAATLAAKEREIALLRQQLAARG